MIMFSNLTRRSFLRTVVCFGFFGLIRPGRVVDEFGAFAVSDSLALSLANVFGRKESARVVGREYLRAVRREADVGLLVDLICSGRADRRTEISQAGRDKLRELLRQQQCDDFEHGRIVNLHGWMLSETEVRLCALAALV